MPPVDSQTPRRFRLFTAIGVAAALGVISLIVFKLIFAGHGPQTTQLTPPSPATNVVMAAPGTMVSAEAVLDKLDLWNNAHPNCHSILTTVFPNGTVISKMDIYSYTNQAKGATVKLNGQIFNPSLEFTGVRENGKMRFYFPRDRQLIEAELKREVFFMPGLPPSISRARDLLKQARSSFAEASADLEVVTLAIDGSAMNITNETLYLSFRINNEGQPLAIGVQAKNQTVMTNIKYVSFDRDVVMRDAPILPTGIPVVTNTTLVQAVLEELRNATPQPLRPRTL